MRTPSQPTKTVMIRGEMYTTTIDADTTVCERKKIILGLKADTICIAVDGVANCYHKFRYVPSSPTYDKTYIGVSMESPHDKYAVRFVANELNDGFLIFVTNLDGWYPSWVMSTSGCY